MTLLLLGWVELGDAVELAVELEGDLSLLGLPAEVVEEASFRLLGP
jgi:hypothetical protein